MAWRFAIAMMTSVDPCVPCLPRSRPRPANPDVPPAGGLCSGCGQRRGGGGAAALRPGPRGWGGGPTSSRRLRQAGKTERRLSCETG